jgi:hypothetical protein
MEKHHNLLEKAREAIDAVFRDTSVSQADTKASLQELADDIQMKIDTLRELSDQFGED